MIQGMVLAGFVESTQKSYVEGVLGLAKHYWRSPDLLCDEEVRSYLVSLRERGVARGTFDHSLRHPLPFLLHARPRLAAFF
jgi:hypothetical protein